jgi:preprotein translocase subunit SecA
MVKQYIDPDVQEDQWDLEGLSKAINSEFTIEMDIETIVNQDDTLEDEQIWKTVLNQYNRHYDSKEQSIGPKPMREIEKAVMLQQLDFHWREHLGAMDYLRQGIHLRGYAQKNPKQEYKKESFEMFSYMMDQLKSSVISILARVRFRGEEDADTLSQQTPDMTEVELKHRDPNTFEAPLSKSSDALNEANQRPYVRTDKKIGRNQPCPCGSGKKYKKCHGAIQQ